MNRLSVTSLLVAVTLGLGLPWLAPTGGAVEFLPVGEDPAGDSRNLIAPAVDVGNVFSSERTDILGLDLAVNGTDLLVKLKVKALPSGTGGYMYAVFFNASETRYFTCYNVQWTGSLEYEENLFGCSRFGNDVTQVGPSTTDPEDEEGAVILSTEEDAEGEFGTVTWTVPLADIDAAVGDELTGIRAETWFRGASLSGFGGTQASGFLWNQADVAPDDGVWDATVGGGPPGEPPPIEAGIEPADLFGEPGDTVEANVSVMLGPGNHSNDTDFSVLLETRQLEWNATFDPPNVSVTPAEPNATSHLSIPIPQDANGGVVTFRVMACHEDRSFFEGDDGTGDNGTSGNETEGDEGSVPLGCDAVGVQITVNAPGFGPAVGPSGGAGTANDTGPDDTESRDHDHADTGDNETGDEEGIPGPGFGLAAAVIGAIVIAARRRR